MGRLRLWLTVVRRVHEYMLLTGGVCVDVSVCQGVSGSGGGLMMPVLKRPALVDGSTGLPVYHQHRQPSWTTTGGFPSPAQLPAAAVNTPLHQIYSHLPFISWPG